MAACPKQKLPWAACGVSVKSLGSNANGLRTHSHEVVEIISGWLPWQGVLHVQMAACTHNIDDMQAS